MGLWWIGNLLFLLVIIPAVVYLLHGLMQPVLQIKTAADNILAGGVTIASQLDLVPTLIPTRDSIKKIGAGVAQYGAALDKIL